MPSSPHTGICMASSKLVKCIRRIQTSSWDTAKSRTSRLMMIGHKTWTGITLGPQS